MEEAADPDSVSSVPEMVRGKWLRRVVGGEEVRRPYTEQMM